MGRRSVRLPMTEENDRALKHGLGEGTVRSIAANVRRASSDFRHRAFVNAACKGLDDMELKARVTHVAQCLVDKLPMDAADAVEVLVSAGQAWKRAPEDKHGFSGWILNEAVGVLGHGDPAMGLEGLRRVTQLFSAEFAIRHYLEQHYELTLSTLETWTADDNEHVRRLVSEGTRPRLPWGLRVAALMDDPDPGIALLERLKDDDAEYVRRSVANHLNDVAKDDPTRVTDICARWWKGAGEPRKKLIRHALRSLVKHGDKKALAVLGYSPKAKVHIEGLSVSPKAITLGERIDVVFDVVSDAKRTQPLIIDYAVHHVKKSGERTRKTFKLKTTDLAPGATLSIHKRHAIKKITTRVYHSGTHAVEVLINGVSHGMAEFELTV